MFIASYYLSILPKSSSPSSMQIQNNQFAWQTEDWIAGHLENGCPLLPTWHLFLSVVHSPHFSLPATTILPNITQALMRLPPPNSFLWWFLPLTALDSRRWKSWRDIKFHLRSVMFQTTWGVAVIQPMPRSWHPNYSFKSALEIWRRPFCRFHNMTSIELPHAHTKLWLSDPSPPPDIGN